MVTRSVAQFLHAKGSSGDRIYKEIHAATRYPRILILTCLFLTQPSCTTLFRSANRPNVLFLIVDTLRADHLGCYGYSRDTSPHLDDLSRNALLFEDVTAQAPWTNPSVVSLFTSLYPSSHHLMTLKSDGKLRSLDEKIITLTQIVKEEGYRTGAFTANPWLSAGIGLERGFDMYRDLPMKTPANRLNSIALEWIRSLQGADPFFLYIQYMDVHGPYQPSQPYDTMYRSNKPGRHLSPEERERMPDYLRIEGLQTLEGYIARYDGGIRFWDECLGTFLDALSTEGYLSNTILVVTADHGEEFLDHGGFNHGSTLYEEQLRVPLILRIPEPAGTARNVLNRGRIDDPVELVDVLPTLLSLIDIPSIDQFQGDDLTDLIRGSGWQAEPVFGEGAVGFGGLPLPEGRLVSVRINDHKLIFNLDTKDPRLYDISSDPGERTNRADSSPAVEEEIHDRLRVWIESCKRDGERYESGELETGQDVLEDLRALGYLPEE